MSTDRSADLLLAWYDRNGRDLPWRTTGGAEPDPYRIWLAEIMLQQTTVPVVIPYYRRFLERWPTLADLAKAERDDVLAVWAGLGYYARARRLHACARKVAGEFGGRFPDTVEALRKLPGIGDYTAGAIAAIAWSRPVAAVDGNVERVMARFLGIEEPLPRTGKTIRQAVESMVPQRRPGDFAQALMDLGSAVCTPRAPLCGECPLESDCQARRRGVVDRLPRRLPRPRRPERHAVAFWLESPDSHVMLRRRTGETLLGGMLEVPSTPFREAEWTTLEEAMEHAPVAGSWTLLPGCVRHGFTHFTINFKIAWKCADARTGEGRWYGLEEFASLALPAMTWKVVDHVRTVKRATGPNERR